MRIGIRSYLARKREEAAAAYRRVFDLIVKFSSRRAMRAMAPRGMGFALRELRRVDEAERACRESLETEPNNSLTLRKPRYMQHQRETK